MRIENSIKNISIGIITQIIMTLLGFISRKVFIDNLGAEYLGINGIMTNVISILGLVESGIGISIVFSLYKPLADKDESKVIALMQLYKNIYKVIAIVVLGLSLFLYPFMSAIMKNNTLSSGTIAIVFFAFVAKNIISYLFAYKWSIIGADQKGYILSKRNLYFSMALTILKILILKISKNYILFILFEVLFTIIQSVINGRIVDKLYPYLKTNKKYEVDKETKNIIVTKVKALFLHSIGSQCIFGTDNLLISSFVSVKVVGLYSNYTMIINQLSSLVAPVIGGIGASVGNLIATENEDKIYDVFKVTYLVNFWIYSFCTIFLYNLLEPFISWWIGSSYLLDKYTFLVILINFYLTGMRTSINTFKSKAGAFEQDKYAPIIEGIINLVVSIILVKQIGLVGIFIGTTISTLVIPFWNQPRIIYKYLFNQSLISYLNRYLAYVLITLIVGLITTNINTALFIDTSFISLIGRGLICVGIINIIYICIFYNTKEFKYILNIFKTKFKVNKNMQIN